MRRFPILSVLAPLLFSPAARAQYTPAAPKYAATGRVLDIHVHTPIAGATVAFGSGEDMRYVQTDADGRFRIEFDEPGDHIVTVGAPGYPEQYVHLIVGQPQTIQLERGMTVIGRVVRASDGAGVPDAKVSCKLEAYTEDARASTSTKADGSFELPGCPVAFGAVEGTELWVSHPHYSAELLLGRHVAGDVLKDVVIKVQEGVPVEGTVVDADANPVADALIVAFAPAPDNGLPPVVGRFNADSQGRFSIGGLAAGSWTIVAVSPNGVCGQRKLDLSKPSRLQIQLPRGETITGRVRVGGKPVPGATVHIEMEQDQREIATARMYLRTKYCRQCAETDEDGRFQFADLTPATYWLTINHVLTGKIERDVKTGETVDVDRPIPSIGVVRFALPSGKPAFDVEGKVYVAPHPTPTPPAAPRPRGVANAVIAAVPAPTPITFWIEDGRATISGLEPGDYDVLPVFTRRPINLGAQAMHLEPGTMPAIDYTIPVDGTIRGHVAAMAAGLPVPSAKVMACISGGAVRGACWQVTITDAKGEFVLEHAVGRFQVAIEDPEIGKCTKDVEAKPGEIVDGGAFDIPARPSFLPPGVTFSSPCNTKTDDDKPIPPTRK